MAPATTGVSSMPSQRGECKSGREPNTTSHITNEETFKSGVTWGEEQDLTRQGGRVSW